jgi:hypothetical protein
LEEGFEDAGRKEEGPEWRNFWDYMREPLEGPVPEKGPEVVDDILLCKTAVDPYFLSSSILVTCDWLTDNVVSHANPSQRDGSTEAGGDQEGR